MRATAAAVLVGILSSPLDLTAQRVRDEVVELYGSLCSGAEVSAAHVTLRVHLRFATSAFAASRRSR